MEGQIILRWPQIVGDRLAQLSLPEKISFPRGEKIQGTLHLNVTSSGALLLHYSQNLILEQINTYFGYKAVSKLRLIHGFIPPKAPLGPKTPAPLTEDEKAWVEEKTTLIEDNELKACLEKLGSSLCR